MYCLNKKCQNFGVNFVANFLSYFVFLKQKLYG